MTTQQVLLLVLLFLSVTFGVLAVVLLFSRGATLQDRLRALMGTEERAAELDQADSSSGWSQSMMRAVVDPVSRLATPEKEEDVSRFRQRFVQAGIRDASAPLWFFSAKAVLALLLPFLYLLFLNFSSLKLTGATSLLLALIFASIGYYLPNYVLDWITGRRKRELLESFPDALDLMVVCVEAGLGLDMAIARVAEEIAMRSEILSDELKLVGLDLRVGSSRERALTNLAARTDLEEVASFVTMLLQAERFGTSMAESLRVHADTLRTKRRLRAEEEAAKIALKMLFPLIFFIFPTLMVVLMGPAMIQVYRVMIPTLSGG